MASFLEFPNQRRVFFEFCIAVKRQKSLVRDFPLGAQFAARILRELLSCGD